MSIIKIILLFPSISGVAIKDLKVGSSQTREAYAVKDNAPEQGLKHKRGLPNQENNPPPTQKATVQIFVPRIFRREAKSSLEEMWRKIRVLPNLS